MPRELYFFIFNEIMENFKSFIRIETLKKSFLLDDMG